MNLKMLIKSLEQAHVDLHAFEKKEAQIIGKELEALVEFAQRIFPFATKREINGEQSLLIYVYPIDDKSLISHEVYLTEKGNITYQVFDEGGYRGYVPDATIEKGFVKMSLTDFLKHKSLKEIHDFFEDRIEMLHERALNTSSRSKEREKFLEQFKDSLEQA